MANKHIIGKHFVSIEIAEQRQAFDTQSEVSDLCRRELYLALEKLFDRYVPENEHWKIDNLTLDLGNIPSENWQKLFIQKTIEQIEEELRNKQNKRKFSGTSDGFPTIKEAVEVVFLNFLQKGSWTWNSPINSIAELEKNLVISEKLVEQITEHVHQNEAIVSRLIWQFSEDFIEKLLAKFNLKFEDLILFFNQEFWQNAFQKIEFSEKKQRQVENYCKLIKIIQLVDNEKVISKSLPFFLTQNQLKEWLKEVKKSTQNNEKAEDLISEILNEKVGFSKEKELKHEEIESIYINQAGLILLHPFLPVFFEKTNLLENDNWKSPAHQRRAVLLCNYLVTGENICEEIGLELHKILCGLPLETPIENEIELNEIELKAIENLLKSVLEHWKALKNTSSDELRGSFLVRQGKLSHKNKQWLLQVKQCPYDMLLDHLPWGKSMIQNKFMPEILRVEW